MRKVILLLILYQIFCISDFENLEICASYHTYPNRGNYGPKGEPSVDYSPSNRSFVAATYNKNTNILWIFGGYGIDPTYRDDDSM